jgi:hypothetical protein
VDFAALHEGGFAQSLIDSFGQVHAGMDDIWSRPTARGLLGRAGGAWLGSGALGHANRA